MNTLPEGFQTYDEARKNSFLKVKDFKDNGGRVVGIFCTFTPSELIMAADAIPIGLCGQSNEPVAAAEKVLPKNLCPLIKSSFGFAYTDTCPFFYFADMIMAETTCDGKKKMYEQLGKIKYTHVMQLPPGRFGKGAFDNWKLEMIEAKEVLEKQFNITISDEKIRESIIKKNEERRAMLDYYEIGKLNPCPASGYEISTISDSTQFMLDIDERIAFLKKRTTELKDKYEKEFKGKTSTRPRILITGCPSGGVRDKVIKTIEQLGADIVGFESCSGPREKMNFVDETIDPITALTDKYLKVSCSVMSPNPGRFEAIEYMLNEYQIDGVVEVILHACHTFNVESYEVKDFVTNKMNKKYISIETDYSPSDTEQINTRLSAFLELF
ncbi:MAG: double-cubane-cluster-containing anaerobic reductase [Lachnospirales bacterium]